MNADWRPVYLEEKLTEIRADGHQGYRSRALPTWCPGCGYFSMSEGFTIALRELGIAPENVVVVSGIGCASRFPFFVNTYGFHTLHGRTLPVATGVKQANDALTVVAVGGDGDAFAIGAGHIPHAARRNADITYMVFDNGIYGLTKGQTSPTSEIGFRTSTSPYENGDAPLDPLLMLLSFRASWVGQAYAGRPRQLAELMAQAIAHRGFSFLHILSPCVTFDKTTRTYANLDMQVRDLPEDHDTGDLMAAMALAATASGMAAGTGRTGKTGGAGARAGGKAMAAGPLLGIYFVEERPTLGDVMEETGKRARARPFDGAGVGE